jgi:hypothetical protein
MNDCDAAVRPGPSSPSALDITEESVGRDVSLAIHSPKELSREGYVFAPYFLRELSYQRLAAAATSQFWPSKG